MAPLGSPGSPIQPTALVQQVEALDPALLQLELGPFLNKVLTASDVAKGLRLSISWIPQLQNCENGGEVPL